MFICKLCDECLSSDQDILGTYCGHIFHKKCLDQHLIHRSPNCPSCEKHLRVDITCISTGYAVLSMYPEEKKQDEGISSETTDSQRSRKNDALQENVMLKGKLVEVVQGLIVMKKELKIKNQSNSSLIPEHDAPLSPSNIAFTGRKGNFKMDPETPHSYSKPNKSITDWILNDILQTSDAVEKNERSDDEHSQTAEKDPDYSESLMSPEMVILRDKSMIGTGLSEEEKNRIIRSKRREYLTWRNKAQSWLSKMEVASKRLLQSEGSFAPEEYREQLRLFYNKAYNQGGLIEEAKQAAAVYLIIDNIPEMEMKEIDEKVNNLTQALSTMLTSILNRMNSVKVEETKLDEELKLTNTSGRNSYVESEYYDDDRQTVIEREVPSYPKIVKSPRGKVVMLISGISDTEIDREPVFV